MKGKLLGLAIGAVALAAVGATAAMAGKPNTKGNGLTFVDMSDSWSLIIQAREPGKCPGGDFQDTGRRMIIVEGVNSPSGAGGLNTGKDGKTSNDILLTEGDFAVIDGNACDGTEAVVSLPSSVATNYDVYIKLIGKPGEETAAQLCATATADGLFVDTTQVNTGEYYCSVTSVRVRNNGRDTYKDITSDLLFLDGSVPLFAPLWEDWLWDWEATNKAKARLVFVPAD